MTKAVFLEYTKQAFAMNHADAHKNKSKSFRAAGEIAVPCICNPLQQR